MNRSQLTNTNTIQSNRRHYINVYHYHIHIQVNIFQRINSVADSTQPHCTYKHILYKYICIECLCIASFFFCSSSNSRETESTEGYSCKPNKIKKQILKVI